MVWEAVPSALVEMIARCERIAWKTKCFRDLKKMLNSTTVALNLANTHRYKPQSCRSPDDGCFPEMTRTSMIWKDLQERATRESGLPGCQAENPTEIIPPHAYVCCTRTDTYEIYDTQELCY